MSVKVVRVENKSDFAELVKVEHEAYSKPLNGFWDILKGPNQAECAARQWAWHQAQPGSFWLAAKDTTSDRIIGGAQWEVHFKNPFEKPAPALTATWWPDGKLKTP
jgi:hypothetical protein